MVTHDIAEAVSMSDRVIVLTRRARVGEIRLCHRICLGAGHAAAVREKDEFPKYFNQIWRDIDVHI
jgi:NitT/TauT family transport system ATP-binding protein